MIALGNEQIKYISLGSTEVVKVYLGTEKVYPVEEQREYTETEKKYLNWMANKNKYCTFTLLANTGTNTYPYFQVSKAKNFQRRQVGSYDWKGITGSDMKIGDVIEVRGDGLTDTSLGNSLFTRIPKMNMSGNLLSLMYGDNFLDDVDRAGNFQYYFQGSGQYWGSIVDLSELYIPEGSNLNYFINSDNTAVKFHPVMTANDFYTKKNPIRFGRIGAGTSSAIYGKVDWDFNNTTWNTDVYRQLTLYVTKGSTFKNVPDWITIVELFE